MKEDPSDREYSRSKGPEVWGVMACSGALCLRLREQGQGMRREKLRESLWQAWDLGQGQWCNCLRYPLRTSTRWAAQAKPSSCRQQRAIEGFWASVLLDLFLENSWQRNDARLESRDVLQPTRREMMRAWAGQCILDGGLETGQRGTWW